MEAGPGEKSAEALKNLSLFRLRAFAPNSFRSKLVRLGNLPAHKLQKCFPDHDGEHDEGSDVDHNAVDDKYQFIYSCIGKPEHYMLEGCALGAHTL